MHQAYYWVSDILEKWESCLLFLAGPFSDFCGFTGTSVAAESSPNINKSYVFKEDAGAWEAIAHLVILQSW